MNNVNNLHETIIRNITSAVLSLLSAEHNSDLNNLGLNDSCIQLLQNMDIKEYNAIIEILNKSTFYGIDSDKFIRVFKSVSILSQSNTLLNLYIQNNASYECCKNFFVAHSARRHTNLRKQFNVNNKVFKKSEDISISGIYEDFYNCIIKNNKINADWFYNYSKEKGITLNKLWKTLTKYYMDGC